MRRTYNTFLIAFSIVLLFLGAYIYFSHGLSVQAASSFGESSLASDNATTPAQDFSGSADAKIAADTAFLATLTSLTKIRIDTSLFSNVAFQKLQDNTVVLEQPDPGRENPFAPINGSGGGSVAMAPVMTNEALQITATSAVLSGTVTNPTGVSTTYFEYGPTATFGKNTANSTPSLIGTYVTTITKLAPKTTYFYRAVAKINGIPLYGEVVSFTTN